MKGHQVFGKKSKTVQLSLEELVDYYRQLEEMLTQDYAAGLKTLRSVEAEASEEAQNARALAQALAVAAASLSRKFDEPFTDVSPTEGGITLNSRVVGGLNAGSS
jgi:hypothetical protein